VESAIHTYGRNLSALILWEPFPEISKDTNFQEKLNSLLQKLGALKVPYLVLGAGENREVWKEKIISFLSFTKRSSFEILPYPSYTRIVPEQINSFVDFLNELAKSKSHTNAETISHFQKIWTHNYLKNHSILSNRKGKTTWLSKVNFYNQTPVFVGASPSLENEIDVLRETRKKIVLLASDTAIQYLLFNKITPDAILSFDPGRGTLYHFLPEIPKSIPILTWLGAASYIFSLENPVYLLNTHFPMDQLLDFHFHNKWPSFNNPSLNLSGMGKALAEMAGSDKFLLSGVSFKGSFGKAHCKGTGYESYRLPQIKRKSPWENINFSKMYSKLDGKNKIAWDKIWESKGNTRIANLVDLRLELLNQNVPLGPASISFFEGFEGFPELQRLDWERAFQEFPEVISIKTYSRWFSV
jgi:hypothetical protein